MTNNNSCSSNSLPPLSNQYEYGIPLYYLNDRDRDEIASHLDFDSTWKFIAEAIQMKPKDINWISVRETNRGSKTLLFLSELDNQGVTLDRLMKAVYDSECKVMPVIDYLNSRYPEIAKKHGEENRIFSQVSKESRNQIRSLPSKPEFLTSSKQTSVLVAYHNKDLNLMLNMVGCLIKNDFNVCTSDNRNSLASKEDVLIRVQGIFNQAKCTLLLVSPAFLQEIDLACKSSLDFSNPNLNSLCIAKLAKGIVEKQSRKVDKLVVALVNDVGEGDTPKWMRSVKMYRWPKEFNQLLHSIIDPNHLIAKMASQRVGCGGYGCKCRSHCPRHGK